MLLITRLNHIGIIVEDVEKAVKTYQNVFNLGSVDYITMQENQVKIAYLSFENIELEFIEPLTDHGEFHDFLADGGGLHHVSVEVDNIQSALRELKEKQIKLVDDEPKVGARESLMVFGGKESFEGLLVEFKQLSK